MDGINISTIHDVNEIEVLRGKQSFDYSYDSDLIDSLRERFTMEDSLYLTAKKGAKFAGFCSVDRDWWEENCFFVREIFVDPAFQNLGIGKELMSMCISHAREKKAVCVVTETGFKNVPMRRLCEKFGFKKWDNPKWKEGVTYKLVF